jgi:hypothetical protein
MNFRGVTWNLNGTRKYLVNTAVLAFLATFAVVFLQETFEVTGGAASRDLHLPGFVPRERRATRGPLGRAVGGLKTFLNGRVFGHGLITEVATLLPDVLVTRWSQDQGPGIIFVNVYVPRHSDDGTYLSFKLSQILDLNIEDNVENHRISSTINSTINESLSIIFDFLDFLSLINFLLCHSSCQWFKICILSNRLQLILNLRPYPYPYPKSPSSVTGYNLS